MIADNGRDRIERLTFEDIEGFDEDHSAGRRRWRGHDLHVVIAATERFALHHGVLGKIFHCPDPAAGLHARDQFVRNLTGIKPRCPLPGELAQGVGEVALTDDVSFRR